MSHGCWRGGGGAQQNLNVTVFKKAIIPLPGRIEQLEISEAINKVYELEACEVEVAADLLRLKKALMSVLLTGELRVSPAEEAA